MASAAAARPRAGSYDPATDSWRKFHVPRDMPGFYGVIPLLWTGREALFLGGQKILALSPAGRFRTIAMPDMVSGGSVCATQHAVAFARLANLRPIPQLQIYDPQTDRWTATKPSPKPVSATLLCTATSVIPIPDRRSPTLDTFRYDMTTRTWTPVAPPSLPGFTPCSPQRLHDSCGNTRWAGHGRFADVWLIGKGRFAARRYDPTTGAWTPIAAGPDIEIDLGGIAWAGSLGATYATADGPGTGPGRTLLVYRPDRR